MPTYEHVCDNCNYTWEDMYSITKDPPDTCPKCNEKTARRVISLSSRGIVRLSGNDYVASLNADAKRILKESKSNENLKANLIGEDKFNAVVK